MSFAFAVATASPRSHRKSDDRVDVHRLDRALVLVVADGAGGIPGAARAADAVQHRVADAVANEPQLFARVEWIVELLRELDEAVERSPLAGETTAVVVVVTEQQVFGASCGDSRAWIVSESGYDDLTVDQKRKSRVGCGRAVPVPFERAALSGTLVVGSDGLFEYAAAEAICSSARGVSPQAAACALVTLVRTPTADWRDDVAVAVARRRNA